MTIAPPEPPIVAPVEARPAARPAGALRVTLVLTAAVLASASAAPLIKATPSPPLFMACGRLVLATALIAPLALSLARRTPEVRARTWFAAAAVPGVLLGLHFAAWNAGVLMSGVAEAALIGNLTPLAMPFLLWAFAHERVTGREWLATAIALAGLMLRTTGPGHVFALGDLVAFAAMLLYAAYLALGKRHRRLPSLWPYVACVYLVGAATCGALTLVFEPLAWPSGAALAGIAALALWPTLVGHSCFNWAMRHVRGQVVALAGMLIPVGSALIAWLVWGDRPGPGWGIAFACVAVSLALVAWPRRAAPVG